MEVSCKISKNSFKMSLIYSVFIIKILTVPLTYNTVKYFTVLSFLHIREIDKSIPPESVV